jgi:hypothetical protein
MSKAEQEAERIIEMYWYVTDTYKIGLEASIIHVEGIIKEYKEWGNMISFNADRLKFYKEVLTILKDK